MEKPKIEVRLEDRILFVGVEPFNLSKSLLSAGVSNVLDSETDVAIELQYKMGSSEELFNEANDLYSFFENNGLVEDIGVFPNELDPPVVAIVGDFDATIYR